MFGLFSSARRKKLVEQMRAVIRESKGTVPEGKEGENPEILLAAIKSTLLREQAARLGILQSLTMPFFYVDVDVLVRFSNKQCMQMLQIDEPPENYYGKTISEVFYNEPGRETLLSKCVKNGDTFTEKELVITSRKGNKLHVLATLCPLYDNNGQCFGAMGLYQNVTEQRALEENLREKNTYIRATADKLDGIARDVAAQAGDILKLVRETAGGAASQARHLGEVELAVRQMYRSVQSIAESSSKGTEISGISGDSAREGAANVDKVAEDIGRMQQLARNLKNDMGELEEEAAGIDSIMSVISDIADQTNLLALNAAIEAARAGDAGRGFAVVAGEVRKLAEKTMKATKDVSATISRIQQSTRTNSDTVDKTVATIGQTMERTHNCGVSLQQIVEYAGRTAEQIHMIAAAAEEQSAAGEQIVGAVNRSADVSKDIDRRMADCLESLQRLEALIKNIDLLSTDLVKSL
ncbi:MAG: methyl-accepting chemotaxis protein [Desulfovibrio sp.]|jgi:methyl-accepting chemotaxis protein|nr:methyl-accepting chemotaxis protein [Desulfovibrio sp.]